MPPVSNRTYVIFVEMDSASLAAGLRTATDNRNVTEGYQLLTEHASSIRLDTTLPDDIWLFYELSRWLTTWPALRGYLASTAGSAVANDRTTLQDFARLQLAKGFIALVDRKLEVVDECVDRVLSLGGQINDYLMASAHFCKARGLRLRYLHAEEALKHAEIAAELLRSPAPALAAVVDLQVHWFHLQSRSVERADRILSAADKTLAGTTDLFNQAYVSYLRARSLRFRAHYPDSVESFKRAHDLYLQDAQQRKGKPHKNIIRVLVNQAKATRLLASKKIAQAQTLLKAAGDLLDDADRHVGEIGGGKLLDERARLTVERGYLALERKAWSESSRIIRDVSRECAGLDDNVVWARIHLLNFRHHYLRMNAFGRPDVTCLPAALDAARKALERAEETDHRRIVCRAHIANGLAALVTDDAELAEQSLRSAEGCITDHDHDYVRDELVDLQQKIRECKTHATVVFKYSLAQLIGVKFDEEVTRMRREVVVRTRKFYKSDRNMKDLTGIAVPTIKAYMAFAAKRKSS